MNVHSVDVQVNVDYSIQVFVDLLWLFHDDQLMRILKIVGRQTMYWKLVR